MVSFESEKPWCKIIQEIKIPSILSIWILVYFEKINESIQQNVIRASVKESKDIAFNKFEFVFLKSFLLRQ